LILKILEGWGIFLKIYEKEAFTKSFILFFAVQTIFLSIVMWQQYKSVAHHYDMKVMYDLDKCIHSSICTKPQKDILLKYTKDDYMKHYIYTIDYNSNINQIKIDIFKKSILFMSVLLFISLAFAYYTLRPLKKALKLNDEFIKDILHDINTPLSALRINLKILKKQFGENNTIRRSQISIDTILDMQSNFTYFLSHSKLEVESINIYPIISQKVDYYKAIYKNLSFEINMKDVDIVTNKEAFSRVVDNIISNACKYNTPNGEVDITYQNSKLIISDRGVGIKHPDKIFDRYYKESQRGIGIGLDIVKKLCDDLDIKIEIESEIGKGSRFILLI